MGEGPRGVNASQRSVTVKLPIAKEVSVLRRILSLTISIRVFKRNFIFVDRARFSKQILILCSTRAP